MAILTGGLSRVAPLLPPLDGEGGGDFGAASATNSFACIKLGRELVLLVLVELMVLVVLVLEFTAEQACVGESS